MSAGWVCPTTCQYAEDVGVPGAASPPCPGGYCQHYAPPNPPAEHGCDHEWVNRPESDTWFCDFCGDER